MPCGISSAHLLLCSNRFESSLLDAEGVVGLSELVFDEPGLRGK